MRRKGLSASQVARRYEISRQTAHYFMQKVREAMKSSESHKMNDSVQVDEFTIGGKDKELLYINILLLTPLAV